MLEIQAATSCSLHRVAAPQTLYGFGKLPSFTIW